MTPADAKARSNRIHARRRAIERFGVDFTAADISRIEAMIRSGDPGPDCVPIRRDRHRNRALHAIRLAGTWMPVLYDEATDSALSVLPAYVLDRYRDVLEPVFDRVPAPPPRPPAGADAPPVGTVVGRVELRPGDVNRSTSARIARTWSSPFAARRADLDARLSTFRRFSKSHPERARLLAELRDMEREIAKYKLLNRLKNRPEEGSSS